MSKRTYSVIINGIPPIGVVADDTALPPTALPVPCPAIINAIIGALAFSGATGEVTAATFVSKIDVDASQPVTRGGTPCPEVAPAPPVPLTNETSREVG